MPPIPLPQSRRHAFTLVEILVVMAVVILLLGFSASALRGVVEGSTQDRAVAAIGAAVEMARQNAVTKSTYSWVAMHSGKDGELKQNAVTVAAFASVDGTRGPNVANPDNVRLLSKVEKFDGVALLDGPPAGNSADLPRIANPRTPTESQFSPRSKDLPDAYRNTNFDWVILFTPRGEAVIDRGPASGQSDADADSVELSEAVQFAVVSQRGDSSSDAEMKSAATLRVNGLTGELQVYQPTAGN